MRSFNFSDNDSLPAPDSAVSGGDLRPLKWLQIDHEACVSSPPILKCVPESLRGDLEHQAHQLYREGLSQGIAVSPFALNMGILCCAVRDSAGGLVRSAYQYGATATERESVEPYRDRAFESAAAVTIREHLVSDKWDIK